MPGNVGVTFECAFGEAIEAEIWAACTSPKTFTNLVFGEHEFAVRAKDAAGNVSEFPAEWGWEVGGFAPTVMITSEPWVNDERRSATFEFQANGANLIFTCSIDGSEMSPCPTTESRATVTKGRKTYNGLALGPHEFEVQVYAPLALEEPLITQLRVERRRADGARDDDLLRPARDRGHGGGRQPRGGGRLLLLEPTSRSRPSSARSTASSSRIATPRIRSTRRSASTCSASAPSTSR